MPLSRKDSHNWTLYSSYLKDPDWSELCGELPEGPYRIVKSIKHRTQTDTSTTYDSHWGYAEFVLAAESLDK